MFVHVNFEYIGLYVTKKKQSTIVLLGAINMYVRFNQYLIIFLYLKFQNNHRGILFT